MENIALSEIVTTMFQEHTLTMVLVVASIVGGIVSSILKKILWTVVSLGIVVIGLIYAYSALASNGVLPTGLG